MNRREMAWVTAIAGTAFVIILIIFWKTLFGPGTWGAGGNMVAWVLCGGLSFLWLNVIMKERHVQQLAQAKRHHDEKMEQSRAHHREQTAQAERHHQAMKAHVTSVAAGEIGE